ncbi:hypothetical protein WDZ11_00225 (plasmid) [Roseomonas mucosa]|uniref:hypothetical protein n=1 Tax=Roseomonas mucosa TaxID=207340 RepID=UPI0030D4AE56
MNHSRASLRRGALGCSAADFAVTESRLLVWCAACRELRELSGQVLLDRAGATATIADILPRLRCSRPGCGAAPLRVDAVDRWGYRRVQISGPGAPM